MCMRVNITGIVENTPLKGPAVDIPWPACEWAVDKSCPEEYENRRIFEVSQPAVRSRVIHTVHCAILLSQRSEPP